ncbi:uncharacterized protein STEHIDRAFT_98926 [Stereum hirsutum FP-91666 SS1]|uniref:uncharacterized protein n=1 Tax=Stereum hirsutum (strain FP-91666) TaxID=721885 RepID=UPI0004449400|nr:uncharacterized protein STEHIDRAFT_98926 [Stereum hirsutum FP-91666 SS1]EIM85381.1 hypothetical protein STEHIDRAFT_98926 [Stereum hirsutum FP-91666 SS1]
MSESTHPTPSPNPDGRLALQFGAGNIGRGFIGPLLSESGYHIVFADVNSSLISSINATHSYVLTILESGADITQTIENVSGVLSSGDGEEVIKVFENPKLDIVTTAVGPVVLKKVAPVIARGLRARRSKLGEKGPVNVIACENMVRQTETLRGYVFEHLQDEEDREWVNRNVGFANCSVDRIVPPATPSHPSTPADSLSPTRSSTPLPLSSNSLSPLTGTQTPLGVRVEGYYEWIVDQRSLKPTPMAVTIPSLKSTSNLAGYLERKLFTLNTGHAITSYLGFILGYTTIDAAIRDERVYETVKGALEESGKTLVRRYGFEPGHHSRYILRIIHRFENPKLGDEVTRVGRQPLRKLGKGDRLMGPVKYALEYGLGWDNLAKGIAAAFMFEAEGDEESVELQRKVKEKGIEGAVEEVLGFERGSEENGKVVGAYEELKTWRK